MKEERTMLLGSMQARHDHDQSRKRRKPAESSPSRRRAKGAVKRSFMNLSVLLLLCAHHSLSYAYYTTSYVTTGNIFQRGTNSYQNNQNPSRGYQVYTGGGYQNNNWSGTPSKKGSKKGAEGTYYSSRYAYYNYDKYYYYKYHYPWYPKPPLPCPPTPQPVRPPPPPTRRPSKAPVTAPPTMRITDTPGGFPTLAPTTEPAPAGTSMPTFTLVPTQVITPQPSGAPSFVPSTTISPTSVSDRPSDTPSAMPSPLGTSNSTDIPTASPITASPSATGGTSIPTISPTEGRATRPPFASDGSVRASAFSVTYFFDDGSPQASDFTAAERITLDHVQTVVSDFYAQFPSIILEDFAGFGLGRATGPARVGYDVIARFALDSNPFPTREELDFVVASAFQPPLDQQLLNALAQLPPSNPFSQTTAVEYNSQTGTADRLVNLIEAKERGSSNNNASTDSDDRRKRVTIAVVTALLATVAVASLAVAGMRYYKMTKETQQMPSGKDPKSPFRSGPAAAVYFRVRNRMEQIERKRRREQRRKKKEWIERSLMVDQIKRSEMKNRSISRDLGDIRE